MIFHITSAASWEMARSSGLYEADSLSADGFIHCSVEGQVARVANASFRDLAGLIVLHIDESLLEAEVRYENLEGGDELFPHVYGPLPAAAVVRATPLQPGPDGDYTFSAG